MASAGAVASARSALSKPTADSMSSSLSVCSSHSGGAGRSGGSSLLGAIRRRRKAGCRWRSVVALPHPSRVAIALPHSSNRRRRCSPARRQRRCEHSRDGACRRQGHGRPSGEAEQVIAAPPQGGGSLLDRGDFRRQIIRSVRDRAPRLASRSRQPCTSPQPTARTVQPRSPASASRPHPETPTKHSYHRRSQMKSLITASAGATPVPQAGRNSRAAR